MQSAATVDMTGEEDATGAEGQVRAHTYGLFGALLTAAPSADLLALLAQVDPAPDVAGGGANSAATDAGFAGAWRQLAIAAEHADSNTLEQEYQDLFIGVGRGEVVPYGSWYMTGFLMDRPLALLRADLKRFGFERQDEVAEPEDHAGALCETMAMLLTEGHHQAVQRQFFEAHMGPWMKSFFRDLSEAKSARFYCAVGQFGEQFIEFESDYLTMPV